MKNFVLVLLAGAVLAMAGFLFAPRLGLGLRKEPFDPSKMANEIMLEVGESLASPGIMCGMMKDTLTGIVPNSTCQQNRYSAAEARDRVDEVTKKYRVKSSDDWDVDVAGFSRNYRNVEQSTDTISQSVLVMVTSDVVIVGYDE